MVPRTGTVRVVSTGTGALQLTKMSGSAPLHATAAVARRVVRLAEDDPAALSELRVALGKGPELGLPYEEVRTRLQHLMVAHRYTLNCIAQPVADAGVISS